MNWIWFGVLVMVSALATSALMGLALREAGW